MQKDLLIIGRSLLDISWISGEPIQVDKLIITESLSVCPGGTGINVAFSAMQFAPKVDFYSRIGGDAFGRILLDLLSGIHFDSSNIKVDSTSTTGVSLLHVHPDGQVGAIQRVGANQSVSIDDLDVTKLSEYGLVHIAGTFLLPGIDGGPTETLMALAKAGGLTTSISVSKNTRDVTGLCGALPHLDFIFMNAKESMDLTKAENLADAAAFFLSRGVGNVVITDGANGAFLFSESGSLHVPAIHIHARDTTGCGDAFAGAFLANLLQDCPMHQCLRLANAAAAHTARVAGAIPTKFTPEQLDNMLALEMIEPGFPCILDVTNFGSAPFGSEDITVLVDTIDTLVSLGFIRIVVVTYGLPDELAAKMRVRPVEWISAESIEVRKLLSQYVSCQLAPANHFIVLDGIASDCGSEHLFRRLRAHIANDHDATVIEAANPSDDCNTRRKSGVYCIKNRTFRDTVSDNILQNDAINWHDLVADMENLGRIVARDAAIDC